MVSTLLASFPETLGHAPSGVAHGDQDLGPEGEGAAAAEHAPDRGHGPCYWACQGMAGGMILSGNCWEAEAAAHLFAPVHNLSPRGP